jgi:hypothetical protein
MQTPIAFYIRCNMVSALVDLAKLNSMMSLLTWKMENKQIYIGHGFFKSF